MDEIMRLYIKINEYKTSYEKAKNNRIELVSTIEELDKRISEGQKYKNIREKEVLSEKIYKAVEKTLSGEIIRIETFGEQHLNRTPIDTKDIYHKIKVDYSFYSESTEDKIKILDEKLKEYLAEKISISYYNAFKIDVLKELTTQDLITMLLERIPTEEHNAVLENIIHGILNFSGNIQGYNVVWFQEQDETLATSPKVVFDEEGKWTELKTHENTNYKVIFDIVYNTFINDVMKKTKNKTKVRK